MQLESIISLREWERWSKLNVEDSKSLTVQIPSLSETRREVVIIHVR